jgi:hypothetical protein
MRCGLSRLVLPVELHPQALLQEALGLRKPLPRGGLIPAPPGRFALPLADDADILHGDAECPSVAPALRDLVGTLIPRPGFRQASLIELDAAEQVTSPHDASLITRVLKQSQSLLAQVNRAVVL